MPDLNTRVIIIDAAMPDHAAIREAASLIRSGQLVAFPTETVYGLGGDGLNPAALSRIYAVKGRPPDNPLILHVASQEQLLSMAAEVPDIAYILMRTFWPGPLTLVLPKTPQVPDLATGGLPTVAVRMPDHPVALALIQHAGTPLAAPSANRSGRPSPTTAQHVLDDLDGAIPLILDGGPTAIGVESTVLDTTCTPPVILRPGGITREALEAVVGHLQEVAGVAQRQRSPGTRYRHYSPKARVLLLEEAQKETLQARVAEALQHNERVGCLLYRLEAEDVPPNVKVTRLGGSVADYAQRLFSALRALDGLGLDVIVVEGVQEQGLGVAVMDRLRRAASPPSPLTEFTET
jgi:L-threonylcarbamoyladenylate synthase